MNFQIQEHVGISNAASPDCPLWPLYFPPERISEEKQTEGESEKIQPCYIHDHMGPLKFRISPTAFFQVSMVLEIEIPPLSPSSLSLSSGLHSLHLTCNF